MCYGICSTFYKKDTYSACWSRRQVGAKNSLFFFFIIIIGFDHGLESSDF